jgi:hypothetical protein
MRVAAFIAGALAAAALAAPVSGGSARPTLRLADVQPLAVTGTAFHSRELVRLQAVGTFGTRAKSVRATTLGRFVARFVSLTGDPCRLRFVKATGAAGSRAVLRLPPGACQPPGPAG